MRFYPNLPGDCFPYSLSIGICSGASRNQIRALTDLTSTGEQVVFWKLTCGARLPCVSFVIFLAVIERARSAARFGMFLTDSWRFRRFLCGKAVLRQHIQYKKKIDRKMFYRFAQYATGVLSFAPLIQQREVLHATSPLDRDDPFTRSSGKDCLLLFGICNCWPSTELVS